MIKTTAKLLISPLKTVYQLTFVGLFIVFGVTAIQFSPATNIVICAGVITTFPASGSGQVKPPSSSHLVARISPLPSHARIFSRSDLFERNTKTSPQ